MCCGMNWACEAVDLSLVGFGCADRDDADYFYWSYSGDRSPERLTAKSLLILMTAFLFTLRWKGRVRPAMTFIFADRY